MEIMFQLRKEYFPNDLFVLFVKVTAFRIFVMLDRQVSCSYLVYR